MKLRWLGHSAWLTSGEGSPKPLNMQGLCEHGCGLTSGSKTRKRVCLKTR